jgi:hypothetical protein
VRVSQDFWSNSDACSPASAHFAPPRTKLREQHCIPEGDTRALDGVVRELSQAQTISDPARARLLKTREAVVAGWNAVAAKLEAQGEIVLGGEVRYFAMHLAPVLTDRERLAAELLQYAKESEIRQDARGRPGT